MSILVTVADFVVAVTGLDDDEVIIGRENYLEIDFNTNIIIVDGLLFTPIGRTNNYDGTEEELNYSVRNKVICTLDFYGTNALTNANKFFARLDSQEAYEFKRDNQIEVFHNTSLTNVKELQGISTYERWQVEIMVKYTEQFTDDVLRIDTLQYQLYSNK